MRNNLLNVFFVSVITLGVFEAFASPQQYAVSGHSYSSVTSVRIKGYPLAKGSIFLNQFSPDVLQFREPSGRVLDIKVSNMLYSGMMSIETESVFLGARTTRISESYQLVTLTYMQPSGLFADATYLASVSGGEAGGGVVVGVAAVNVLPSVLPASQPTTFGTQSVSIMNYGLLTVVAQVD